MNAKYLRFLNSHKDVSSFDKALEDRQVSQ